MDYKYNEKEYGKAIFEKGFQSDFIKYELVVLVKYLKFLKYNKKDTEKFLYEFCEKYIEGFNKVQYFKIIDKAIKDGRKTNNKLIEIKEIMITKNEMEYIDFLDIEYNYKKLLLAFLVRKKIALEIHKLSNPEAVFSTYFNGSKKSYKEIFQMANIGSGYKVDLMINELVEKGILISIIKGDIVLDYINNINKENDEVYEVIKDFDNVGFVFDYYKRINNIKKCDCFEKCGSYIKITTSNKKYCAKCRKEVNRIKTLENWHKNKSKNFEATTPAKV